MKKWFYLDKDNKQTGPVNEDVFKDMIQNGNIEFDCLVWSEGMDEWVEISKISSLASLLKVDSNNEKEPTPPTPPESSEPSGSPSTNDIVVESSSPLTTGIEPRSYWGSFIIIFFTNGLFFGLVMGFVISLQGIPFILSFLINWILFGTASGLFMAHFIKGKTLIIKFENKEKFIAKVNVAMSQMGYNQVSSSEYFLDYKPSFFAGLQSGKFSVAINGNEATLVGPAPKIKKMQLILM